MILKALSQISQIKFPKAFSLEYQSRTKSKDFLDSLNDDSVPDNIDAAYMKQAFECSKNWFLKKNEDFISHLKPDANNETDEETDKDADKDANSNRMDPALASHINGVLKEQTRFIWDEIDASSNESEQKVFAERNTGKLELTDAELIKSLFMNPEYYGDQRNNVTDRQILISELWDIYENELHKADFWAFLPLSPENKENYASRTRIDAIFHLLAKKEKENIKTEENGLFKAIQNWIYKKRENPNQGPFGSVSTIDPMAQVMHQCWRDVCDLMDGMVELYENNEIYNLLSLYKMTQADNYNNVLTVYLDILKEPKDSRSAFIKGKIKVSLFPEGISECIRKQRFPSNKIKNLLVAHNVAIINTTTPRERFAFKFFEKGNPKEYIWDREHIYASNEAYIEHADINEKRAVLSLFSEEDSYKRYINYLYFGEDSEGNNIQCCL